MAARPAAGAAGLDHHLRQNLRVVGGGYSIRPSGEAAIAPEAAGPQRAHRRRETLTLSEAKGTARDPAARRAAGSRPQELRAAASGGEQGPNAASPEGLHKRPPRSGIGIGESGLPAVARGPKRDSLTQ